MKITVTSGHWATIDSRDGMFGSPLTIESSTNTSRRVSWGGDGFQLRAIMNWTSSTQVVSAFSIQYFNDNTNKWQTYMSATSVNLSYGDVVAASPAKLLGRNDFIDFRAGGSSNNVRGSEGWGGAGSDTLYGSIYSDRLYGDAGTDRLYGGAGNDILNGGAGSDILNGGAGADTLLGGAGNDTYYVDNTSDRVYETTTTSSTTNAGGTDRVFSSVSFNLSANKGVSFVENLTLKGASAIDGTGNALKNVIVGNGAANKLDGRGGNDTLKGGGGNDTLVGGAGNDTLEGGAGNDTYIYQLFSDGSDFITDTSGSDRLVIAVGGAGAGLGEGAPDAWAPGDIQLVGSNLVITTSDRRTITIAGNSVEALRVTNGTYSMNATLRRTGTVGDDWIYGTASGETLSGGAGGDWIYGGKGNDTLLGGAGNDYLIGGAGNDRLDGGTHDSYDEVLYMASPSAVTVNLGTGIASDGWGGTDTLINITDVVGSAFGDRLTGSRGDDWFQGFKGNDTINGGAGFDAVAYFDALQGVTVNLATGRANDGWGGTDVLTSVEAVEGSLFADVITGNAYANRLSGYDGKDTISGGGGSDTLSGGLGQDRLTGGTGADRFVFEAPAEGGDTITDFSASQGDRMEFGRSAFGGLPTGGLASARFQSVASGGATLSGTRFVYNTGEKALYFDADGSGAAAAVRVATFSNGAVLRNTDIFVV